MIQETLITLLLFAISPVVNKYLLQFISVKSLVLLTGMAYILTSSLLLFLFYDNEIEKDILHLFKNGKYLWLILLILPLMHIITHYFYFSLIRDYKTYFVTALVASYPLLTALFGYLVLNETISLIHVIGILFIVTGVSLLT